MGTRQPSNSRSSSTTWAWKKVKVAPPPEANKGSAPQARRWYTLPTLDWRRPTTIKVKYRGGPEAWWEIHARGAVGRFPGSVCIHDVMREIFRQP